jgi:hypothetical protein
MGFREIYNTLKKMPAMGSGQAMKLKQAAMSRPMSKPIKPIVKMQIRMKKYQPMETITPKNKMPR